MIEFIPYFAGLITILFGVGFYSGLQEFKKIGKWFWIEGVKLSIAFQDFALLKSIKLPAWACGRPINVVANGQFV